MAEADTRNVDMTDDQIPDSGEYPFERDLNPNFLAGENYGEQGPHPEKSAHTAYDVKGAHAQLQAMEDDDLKRIPIMPEGSRLEQGAVYVDLKDASCAEITARGDMVAGSDTWYVPKTSVPYWIWNRMRGIQNPERLDAADEG